MAIYLLNIYIIETKFELSLNLGLKCITIFFNYKQNFGDHNIFGFVGTQIQKYYLEETQLLPHDHQYYHRPHEPAF